MTIKEQFKKIKDNWFLILLSLVLIFVLFGGLSGISSLESTISPSYSGASGGYSRSTEYAYAPSTASYDYAPSAAPSMNRATHSASLIDGTSTTPEATAQMVAKTASMSTEVERGQFSAGEANLKSIVTASDAIMLSQNVNTYGSGSTEYQEGDYQIKVDSKKYDTVVAQLKAIGKTVTFTESAEDVTKTYNDLGVQLDSEKNRLQRYDDLYAQANTTDEKLNLIDKIFDQENTVKYLNESLQDVGNRVVYSTIGVTITEKQSGYAELTFVKLSDLVQTFVGSLGALLFLIVAVIPWALIIWLVVFVVRKIRKPKFRK